MDIIWKSFFDENNFQNIGGGDNIRIKTYSLKNSFATYILENGMNLWYSM